MGWTQEQLQAIQKEGTNIIVSAGAGSGKTAVLSERVLRKIKDGVPIEKLLILTFTNAAASEMKERIRKKLFENNYLEEAEKIDIAYITTFDSYALSVVKKYHYYFNISKDIKIADMGLIALKKEEILGKILEYYYKQKNPKFLKLIDDFCTKDDHEIMSSILDISNKLDLKYDKEDYLKQYIQQYYDHVEDLVEEYSTFLLNKKKKLYDILEELKYLVEESYFTKVQITLKPLLEASNYQQIKENTYIKLPSLPKGSEEDIKKIKKDISQIIKELKKYTKYENEDQMIEEISLTKDYAEVICSILLEFTKELKQYKLETNQFEFIDLSKMAIELLEHNKEIRKEITDNYQEILLDEYQDTNDLQEQFISMISNNNVYMVGDIKQSIYRFRNANPNIFKEKYDCYKQHQGGIKIDLNKNFRSRKEVVNNINLIFNYVMDFEIGSADYKENHQMIYGNQLYEKDHIKNQNHDVEILKYNFDSKQPYSKSEIEIFMIARDIQNKIKSNYLIFDKDQKETRLATYSDFVILMDRSTSFSLYKKIFEYLGIPLTICRDENITSKTEMNLIKNIIHLIQKQKNQKIDEEYQYYYMSLARSYLFQIPDDQIFKTIQNHTYEASCVIQKINKIITKMDFFSLTQLIEMIIDVFNFYEKLSTVGDIQNSIIGLEYLLDLSRQLANQGYDLERFGDYLSQIVDKNYQMSYSLNNNIGNCVRIMTIHRSKGLEFPVCYYSGLYATFNIHDIRERFNFDSKYGMILPIFKEGIDHTIVFPLVKEQYMKEEISEKIRLLYVGMTRAKEQMIFLLPNEKTIVQLDQKVPDLVRLKYQSFADILNSVSELLDPFVTLVDISTLNITKDYNFMKKANYHPKMKKNDQKLIVSEWIADSPKIKHQSFSNQKVSLYQEREYKNIELGKQLHKKLEYQSIEQHPIIQKYFSKKPLKIYREYEFMYQKNEIHYHGVIDLMLEYENLIIIVDYKLNNIGNPNYISQLFGYQHYIQHLTSKPVEVYLYSIVSDKMQKIKETVI